MDERQHRQVSFSDGIPKVARFTIASVAPESDVSSVDKSDESYEPSTPSVAGRAPRRSRTMTYGDDWERIQQDRTTGIVDFVLHEEGSNEVVISQFHRGETGRKTSTVYLQKKCPYRMNATPEEAGFVQPISKQLDQFRASSICANDCTSSVIYTAGLVAATSSYYTPVCLFLVVFLLYFFRGIYVELVSALPLNGGTYTGILNTTRKGLAVVAACLSFLAYVATVVVSANSAMNYLKGLWSELNVMLGTIVVICLFGALMLIGIKESAAVALVLFSGHLITVIILVACSFAYACSTKFSILKEHYTGPGPSNPFGAIVLGFGNAMLGITGYETSANFVEHQRPGVYPKTLRNMWFVVALINPTVGILGFSVIPPDHMYNNGTLTVTSDIERSFMSVMGRDVSDYVGGRAWVQKLVVVDAVLVLSGAVLTGYVGVVGLLKRMVDDDIFPRKFLAQLPITGANYLIIGFFCAICCTLILITLGDIRSISGVYTVAFLSVMFLFCLSTLILKHTRRDLKRDRTAKWYTVIFCMCGLIIALVANCIIQPMIIAYTALYFAVCMMFFYGMFSRSFLIRAFLRLTKRRREKSTYLRRLHRYLVRVLVEMENVPVVFFSRRMNLHDLNKAVQRVQRDELSRRLTVVHVYNHVSEIPASLHYSLRLLDSYMYPNIRIDILLIKGTFGPGAVRLVEALLDVPPNRMFIVSPSEEFQYNVAQLGSVRIIMGRKDRNVPNVDTFFGGIKPNEMTPNLSSTILDGPVFTFDEHTFDKEKHIKDQTKMANEPSNADALADHYVTIRGIADFRRFITS